MINEIKGIAMKRMPNLYNKIKWLYVKHFTEYGRLIQYVIKRQGLQVSSGPFTGMRYIHFAYCSALIPKILGSYESELHSVFNKLINQKIDYIVDIGCAEGYYAVGLARALFHAQIVAFEMSEYARILCRDLARINNVSDRITIFGKCSIESLADVVRDKSLIISDCEGYEIELLDPKCIKALHTCTLVIELHDLFNPNISTTIINRFQNTHDISIIQSGSRNPDDYSVLQFLTRDSQRIALDERPQSSNEMISDKWAILEPKINE